MASMDNNGDLGHQEMHCSFCHKSRSQVSKLVQGPNGVFICDECIRACADMIGQPVDEFDVDDIESSDSTQGRPEQQRSQRRPDGQ